jgi:subtilase-type serine protease
MKKLETAGSGRRKKFARSVLCAAIAGGLALSVGASAFAQAYQEQGRVGDAGSWRTDEFKADWGLAAIGAEYAYARGLTGRGIRLGVFDSGVDLRHGDFAGKDHRGIRIADLLGDGTACTNTTALTGPDSCFMSDGDTVAIDYFHYTDEDREFVAYLVSIGYLYDWVPEYLESIAGFSYSTHGTHVAGTMAANRDGVGAHGVGFGADLTTSRLFSNTYQDFYSLIGWGDSYQTGPGTDAIASMYEQMSAQSVRAINHSWGLASEPTTVEEMDWLYGLDGVAEYFSTFANPSLQDGIIQVWAAGNGYGEIAGIYASLPRWVEGLDKYWLSVANLSWTGELADSSSICGQTKDWCITAPGTDITSTVVGGEIEGEVIYDADGNFVGYEITGENPEYGYGDLTGTSMAAPHVTGALALLMERFPYLDNPQIRDVLLTTAFDLGEEGVDEIYGWGLMDLRKAIDGPGQIRVDTDVVMNQRAGGAQVWEGLAWDDWANDIGGPGRLTKSGIGWLRLSGDNSFNGLTVREGVLELTGSNSLGDTVINGGWGVVAGTGVLANAVTVNNGGNFIVDGLHMGGLLTVNAGGRLGGSGTVGTTMAGGTVAPGNSIGTLTVDGDYTSLAGSTFEVEFGADGASDLLQVTGTANLLGGTVRVLQVPGSFLLGQSYSILSAMGGVNGQFSGVDSSGFSPFLQFNLVYGTGLVGMDVVRGQALATAAQTANQRAVATAADALAIGQGLPQPLTQLFPAQAPAAFDALSGEVHASVSAVLVDESRHVRDVAMNRAQPMLSPVADDAAGTAAWLQVLGGGGKLRDNGNAAQIDSQSSGVLFGVDHGFANGWRIGALAGTGRSDMQVIDRASSADVDSRHLGVYVGNAWGGVKLRGGAAYARHDVDTHRDVEFPGFSDRNEAGYRADTLQAFVEGGYRFGGEDWAVEPFAQFAHVEVDGDGFAERGGVASLTGETGEMRTNLSTVGVRLERGLRAAGQDANWLVLRGGLGWRHASGDRLAATTVAWTGGSAFTVTGAAIADSAVVADIGIGAWISPSGLLELNYSGQYDDEARDHGLSLRYSLGF